MGAGDSVVRKKALSALMSLLPRARNWGHTPFLLPLALVPPPFPLEWMGSPSSLDSVIYSSNKYLLSSQHKPGFVLSKEFISEQIG